MIVGFNYLVEDKDICNVIYFNILVMVGVLIGGVLLILVNLVVLIILVVLD